MSQSYKKYGIVGGPLGDGVIKQLKTRQHVLNNKQSRTADQLAYLTSNTSWCKVTSAVDVDINYSNEYADDPNYEPSYSNVYAKYNQLFGGTYSTLGPKSGFPQGLGISDSSGESSYSFSNTQGIVPMPGITSFQVTSQGTYGTLRAGSFNFTVHSVEQFNIMEELYLRPGFTILMEWGHSNFFTDKENFTSTATYYDTNTFSTKQTEQDIRSRLLDIRSLENAYNYDYLYGFIKNFQWTYNGGNYECQVDVISKGELISSISQLFVSNKQPKEDQDKSTELESILKLIKNAPGLSDFEGSSGILTNTASILYAIKKNAPDYIDIFKDSSIPVSYFSGNTTYSTSNTFKYITLRDFLSTINKAGLLQGPDGENIINFKTDKEFSPAFTTFPEHIALNPYICVLPGKSAETSAYAYNLSSQATGPVDEVLSIYLNIDYILTKLEELAKLENKEDRTVLIFLNSILKGIQTNLGDINEFHMHYDEDESTYSIVDKKIIPDEKQFSKDTDDPSLPHSYIDVAGLGTEVSNLNVVSKLSGKLTTMLSIAAGSSNTSDSDTLNVQRWNTGLRDRHLYEKADKKVANKKEGNKTETDNAEKRGKVFKEKDDEFKAFIDRVNKPTSKFKVDLPESEFEETSTLHQSVMEQYLNKITVDKKINAPGLIPFELSFTMKGISGMKVGQAFKVNEFFLPKRYQKRVAYIITGLDHQVTDNKWVTNVKSQIIFT